jgi:hypothetical protein
MYNNNNNNLPPGWMQATDPASGRIYYCNPTSKETRWDPPSAPIPIPAPPLPLPVPLQLQPVPVVPDPCSVAASVHSSSTHSSSTHAPSSLGKGSGRGTNAHSTSQQSSSYSPDLSPDLIVPVVRSLFDKVASLPDPALALDLELDGLTAGEIADLCHIQQADTHGSNQAYLPLNPYKMPILAKRPEVEHARLDVRIVELKEKLQRYGGYKS